MFFWISNCSLINFGVVFEGTLIETESRVIISLLPYKFQSVQNPNKNTKNIQIYFLLQISTQFVIVLVIFSCIQKYNV